MCGRLQARRLEPVRLDSAPLLTRPRATRWRRIARSRCKTCSGSGSKRRSGSPTAGACGMGRFGHSGPIRRDIQSIIRLLEAPVRIRSLGLEVPTGLLLVGPPGTGKTLIANLIASQTNRSFYPLTAASVLGGGVGDSVKRVAAVFSWVRNTVHLSCSSTRWMGCCPHTTATSRRTMFSWWTSFLQKSAACSRISGCFWWADEPSRGHRFKGASRWPLLGETNDSATQCRTSSAAPQSDSTRHSHAARLNHFRSR